MALKTFLLLFKVSLISLFFETITCLSVVLCQVSAELKSWHCIGLVCLMRNWETANYQNSIQSSKYFFMQISVNSEMP